MSSISNYHVVPWYNSDEWHYTYRNLLSRDLARKEEALKMLYVWKARCPALPSGIESTLGLLQVHIEDMKSNNTDSGHQSTNDEMLRLAYSTAIMRFVNHMLDCETEKGTSLYRAAKMLGVPDWIVDLRHETAHSSSLPPTILLKEACSLALNWLWENYWDKHKPFIKDFISGQKDYVNGDGTITHLINSCISLGICSLPNLKIRLLSQIPDAGMRESLTKDLTELFADIGNFTEWNGVPIVKVIDFINEHSKQLLRVKNVSTVINEALLGEDSLFLSRELLYFFSATDFKYKDKLNGSYVKCFEILLDFLHTNDLLLDFLLALIKVTQSPLSGYFKARLAALWCSEILAALQNCHLFVTKSKRMRAELNTSKVNLKAQFITWFPDRNQTGLTLHLLKAPPPELQDVGFIQPIIAEYNQYLTYFIKDLLDLLEPGLTPDVANRICALTNLISMPDKYPISTTANIYTADDIRVSCDDVVVVENVANMEDEKRDAKKFKNKVWKLASREYQWNSIPIGQVPTKAIANQPD